MWTARVFGAKQRRTNTEEESRDEAEIPRRFPISKWGSKKTTNQRAMDRAAIVDYTDRQAQSPEPLLPNNTVKLPPIRQNKLPPIQRNKTAEETAWGKLKNKLEVAVKKAAVDEGELGTIPDGIGKLVIHPDNPRKMAWDLFIGVCIMYSATTIPYRLAFDAVASLSRPDTVRFLSEISRKFVRPMSVVGSLLISPQQSPGRTLSDCSQQMRLVIGWRASK